MEHIVQFAIGIDDDEIAKRIQSNAEKTITANLQNQIGQCIFRTGYYGRTDESLNDVAKDILLNWLDNHKQEIIRLASEALADKLIRTKAVRTAINDAVERYKND